MVSAHAYPTVELSDAVSLLAKTAAKERKLGPCPEIPYCPEIPSLTLLTTLTARVGTFIFMPVYEQIIGQVSHIYLICHPVTQKC